MMAKQNIDYKICPSVFEVYDVRVYNFKKIDKNIE